MYQTQTLLFKRQDEGMDIPTKLEYLERRRVNIRLVCKTIYEELEFAKQAALHADLFSVMYFACETRYLPTPDERLSRLVNNFFVYLEQNYYLDGQTVKRKPVVEHEVEICSSAVISTTLQEEVEETESKIIRTADFIEIVEGYTSDSSIQASSRWLYDNYQIPYYYMENFVIFRHGCVNLWHHLRQVMISKYYIRQGMKYHYNDDIANKIVCYSELEMMFKYRLISKTWYNAVIKKSEMKYLAHVYETIVGWHSNRANHEVDVYSSRESDSSDNESLKRTEKELGQLLVSPELLIRYEDVDEYSELRNGSLTCELHKQIKCDDCLTGTISEGEYDRIVNKTLLDQYMFDVRDGALGIVLDDIFRQMGKKNVEVNFGPLIDMGSELVAYIILRWSDLRLYDLSESYRKVLQQNAVYVNYFFRQFKNRFRGYDSLGHVRLYYIGHGYRLQRPMYYKKKIAHKRDEEGLSAIKYDYNQKKYTPAGYDYMSTGLMRFMTPEEQHLQDLRLRQQMQEMVQQHMSTTLRCRHNF